MRVYHVLAKCPFSATMLIAVLGRGSADSRKSLQDGRESALRVYAVRV